MRLSTVINFRYLRMNLSLLRNRQPLRIHLYRDLLQNKNNKRRTSNQRSFRNSKRDSPARHARAEIQRISLWIRRHNRISSCRPLHNPGDNSAVQLPTTPLYGFGIGLTYGVTDGQGKCASDEGTQLRRISWFWKSATPPKAER